MKGSNLNNAKRAGRRGIAKAGAFLALFALLLCGCAEREKVVYQKVNIPVSCATKMPEKPENKGDFESAKGLMIYYLECEDKLKGCVNGR